jgi:hypothetical protein
LSGNRGRASAKAALDYAQLCSIVAHGSARFPLVVVEGWTAQEGDGTVAARNFLPRARSVLQTLLLSGRVGSRTLKHPIGLS